MTENSVSESGKFQQSQYEHFKKMFPEMTEFYWDAIPYKKVEPVFVKYVNVLGPYSRSRVQWYDIGVNFIAKKASSENRWSRFSKLRSLGSLNWGKTDSLLDLMKRTAEGSYVVHVVYCDYQRLYGREDIKGTNLFGTSRQGKFNLWMSS